MMRFTVLGSGSTGNAVLIVAGETRVLVDAGLSAREIATAAEAAERRAPHGIPIYAIRVADDFHRFYHEHRVVGSEAEAFRLALCRATQHVIARCLDLIGVDAPERM